MTTSHGHGAIPARPASATDRPEPVERGGQALLNGKPSYTSEQAAQQIIRHGHAWLDRNGDGKIDLTYSFLSAPNQAFIKMGLRGFSEFSSLQKAQAALALQAWADVADIAFTEAQTGGDGHLTFGNSQSAQEGVAFAFQPNINPIYDGQSWYLVDDTTAQAPGLNNFDRQTLVHEIGHNLGLSHPSDYDADTSGISYAKAEYAQDTRAYSVMSYWNESHSGQSFTRNGERAYASAPLIDDIAAIQKLYGANHATRTDDSVYGFNSNTNRDFLSARSSTDKLVFSVWDGGGNDTLDFSGFNENQRIDLNAGAFSDVGGLVGNVSIAHGVMIENAIGGSGNDRLIGNDLVNELRGGDGSDILRGAGGADKLWGAAGRDTFEFRAISDSSVAAPDQILDFCSGQDRIDLTAITRGAGLNFVKTFTGQAGQAVLSYSPRFDDGALEVDFTGNGVADFRVLTVGQVRATDILA
ncbi:serralysin family metalloprotease [Pseudomonas asplenii]|uniref:serralysin family metalloprotease n=1 Tax=Pseudomonas asplenii TaxID=53407 RepID=UPI00036D019E|nr:serralysin family metalloprotease [Pseudomonas fuscovaginae]